MFGITRLILNLSIGAKLGIASGLGVLLVATMVIVQIRANAATRDLDARMSGQQTIARDAVEAKASVAGMQVAVRDLRLANNSADLQKAIDSLAARLKSLNHYGDEMLRISKSAENRARIEKLKTRAGDYAKGAQQIVTVRTEAVAAAGGADAAAKIAKLNEEVARIAREVTLPIVAELEPIANQIAEFAKHNVEEQAAQSASEMAMAEWESMALGIGTMLLLILTSIFSYFTIGRPMRALSVSMDELAGGNFAVVLPGLGRKDELGAVAGAVEKFKVVSEQKARDEAEARIKQDQIAAQQRKAEMVKLADSFEAAVGEIVETVSSASTELEASAGTLTSTAERAQEVTTMVAAASEEATTNVQSVASATEELSSSVNEISRQVQESARMAREAVEQARTTNDRVGELSKAAARIGDVVETHQHHRGPDQSAGAQCHDRGGTRRRGRPGLCGRGLGSEGARRTDREGNRRDRTADHGYPGRDPGVGGSDQGDQRHHRKAGRDRLGHCGGGGGAGRGDAGNLPQRAAGGPGHPAGFLQHHRRPARRQRDRLGIGSGALGGAVAVQ
jgi:HAMP domain-containing protein